MTEPHPDHAGRRRRLRARLGEAGEVDALLVTHPPNVAYLCGFRGSRGCLVLGEDQPVLLTDGRYAERAREEAPEVTVRSARGWMEAAADAVAEAGHRRVGFEAAHLAHAAGERLAGLVAERGGAAVGLEGEVEALRVVKDRTELARLERACSITADGLGEVLEELAPGMTEQEVAARLYAAFAARGAEDRAFPAIVAAGPHGARPHHAPTDRPLRSGELVVIDCGARVEGYHADMTRTVALGQAPTALAEVHEVVRRAQRRARAAAVAGGTCEDVDAAARREIEAAGHAQGWLHGVGHGIGLEIHEPPLVSAAGAASLEAATVITVEPGVYLPGTGGVRIEDTVVVSEQGPPRVLTELPRELVRL